MAEHRARPYGRARREKSREAAVEEFAAAALIFAAKLALYLGAEQADFLRNAARAFALAEARGARRAGVETEGEEGPKESDSSAPG